MDTEELIQLGHEMGLSDPKKAFKNACHILYLKSGQTAVYNIAKDLLWEEWSQCGSCEDETPHMGGECLVCGS